MRHRTAVKTGRTAAMQAQALSPRPITPFTDYAAMVERLAAGDFRPLHRHQLAPRRVF